MLPRTYTVSWRSEPSGEDCAINGIPEPSVGRFVTGLAANGHAATVTLDVDRVGRRVKVIGGPRG